MHYKYLYYLAVFGFFGILGVASCQKQACWEEETVQFKLEKIAIENYLAVNDSTALFDSLGYFYRIETEGSGYDLNEKGVTINDRDTVLLFTELELRYEAYLLSDLVAGDTIPIVSYPTNPVIVPVEELIPGFYAGLIAHFKIGSIGRLYIPSCLGYGAEGLPDLVPANSTLVFDVEVVEVHPHF